MCVEQLNQARSRVSFMTLGVGSGGRGWLRLLIVVMGTWGVLPEIAVEAQNPSQRRDPADDGTPRTIRAAVERALPLLKAAAAEEYPKHRDCFSCHNQAVPAVALALAKQRGFVVDDQTLQAIAEHTEGDLNSAVEEYRQGKGQPGSVIRAGYALWTLEAAGWAPDETTSAVAHYLAVIPGERDHWPSGSNRPPSEKSKFTATYLALRGLHAFHRPDSGKGGKGGKPDVVETRTRNALAWLKAGKAEETEDRVFRLWALKLAGAGEQDLRAAASELLKTQRGDGGWSQLDSRDSAKGAETRAGYTSDAYATGSALVALHLAAGLSTDDPAYRRGLNYLLQTQLADGSWLVKSRSKPFQPYFESGFPHGKDQFISAAGTAWAVGALVLACPAP